MTNTPRSTVVLLDASPLAAARDGGVTLFPSRAFADVCDDMLHLVGAFGQRVVFLYKQLCVCSIKRLTARSGGGADTEKEEFRYVKHFFIPSDWYSQRRTLKMKVTVKGGRLVC